jgi:hypothetical protein
VSDESLLVRGARDKVGMQVKSDHPAAYRSGQWGLVVGVSKTTVEFTNVNGNRVQRLRHCYQVIWPDGATDQWPVVDPQASYIFQGMPDTENTDAPLYGKASS